MASVIALFDFKGVFLKSAKQIADGLKRESESIMKKALVFLFLTITLFLCLTACHTHSYGEWTVIDNPTCTKNGLKERTCECGRVDKQTIRAFGHVCGEWEIIEEATCTKNGLKERTCECGKNVDQDEIPATGHIYGKWETIQEPSCTVDGVEKRTCECGISEQRKLWATGHAGMDDCNNCGYMLYTPSEGLNFALNDDGQCYSVVGIGTCKDAEIVIPNRYNDLPVTGIGDSAFYYSKAITSIKIPSSVTSIDNFAFIGSSIEKMVIPDNVKSVGGGIFFNCTSLVEVRLGSGITEIKSHCDSIMDYGMFSGCSSLTSITIPDTITHIDKKAFYYCTSLKSITFGNSVTNIGSGAFWGCSSIENISLPDSLKSIENDVFLGCYALTDVTIGNSVTSIGNNAFYGCNLLTSITFPTSVTQIGNGAFMDCTSLTSITISDSVTNIGGIALYNCTSLEKINYNGTTEQWNAIIKGYLWDSETGDYTIHCKDGTI